MTDTQGQWIGGVWLASDARVNITARIKGTTQTFQGRPASDVALFQARPDVDVIEVSPATRRPHVDRTPTVGQMVTPSLLAIAGAVATAMLVVAVFIDMGVW